MDRSLYRELVKQAIARTVTELEAHVPDRAAEKHAQRRANAELPLSQAAEARREEQRAIREIAVPRGARAELDEERTRALSLGQEST